MSNAPTFFVDDVMYLLESAEFKVLMFATHRIVGEKIPFDGLQEAPITLAEFANRVGMSRPTVIKILDALCFFNLLNVRIADDNRTRLWSIQPKHLVRFDLMGQRKSEKDIAQNETMKKVRRNIPASVIPGYGSDRVYLIEMGDSGYFKIGHSMNPRQRVHEFNTPLPIKFICAIECENAVNLEAELHAVFKDKRSRAEWFQLDSDDVEYIKGLVHANNL